MNIKKSSFIAVSLAVLVAIAYFGIGANQPSQMAHAKDTKKLNLESEKAKMGYTIGSQMGQGLTQQGVIEEIDIDALAAAIKDVAAGTAPQMSVEEMQATQTAYQAKREKEFEALAAENKTKGEAFLAKSKAEKGVVATDSGLQYQVLTEGKGKQPRMTDSVKVHYKGSLIDDTVFDSSYKRNAPADFPVTGVIPGFSEGLQLMKEGSKYRFVIPSDLAYGPQGPGPIGPNQVLVFEVELLEVLSAEEPPAAKEPVAAPKE